MTSPRTNGEILHRAARLLVVAEAAASTDADLAAQRDYAHAHIRADFQQIADALANHGQLLPELTPAEAADATYALANETTYLLLTEECGWSATQYIDWLATTLQATLSGRRPSVEGPG